MSTYHLRAHSRERDLQTGECDDRVELDHFGGELARLGFAVQVYGRDSAGPVVVSEWNGQGERVR